jgi:hypothetical protein
MKQLIFFIIILIVCIVFKIIILGESEVINLNKYQKYLNTKAKRLFKLNEEPYNSYRDCRMHWNYALNNYKHYIIMLEGLNIIRRDYKRIWV